jgi:hypothetical protein
MPPRTTAAIRTLVTCLLIVSTLLVSAAIVSGVHEHSDSHCCDFCHFGHLPWVQTSTTAEVQPEFAREWRQCSENIAHCIERCRVVASSRAPPVQS